MPRVPYLVLVAAVFKIVSSLQCAQCTGWHGSYPLKGIKENTCHLRNNHCQTDLFCIKIIDPMAPGLDYSTFRADCWFQNRLQVTPNESALVEAGKCYYFRDASTPPKRFKYCFCNDTDYCNGSQHSSLFTISSILVLATLSL